MPRDSLEVAIGDRTLALLSGDITKIPADAIGNAANSGLRGGGGVDGAIHRAGGPAIMRELDAIRRRIGKCAAGDAVATGAGNLPGPVGSACRRPHLPGWNARGGRDSRRVLSALHGTRGRAWGQIADASCNQHGGLWLSHRPSGRYRCPHGCRVSQGSRNATQSGHVRALRKRSVPCVSAGIEQFPGVGSVTADRGRAASSKLRAGSRPRVKRRRRIALRGPAGDLENAPPAWLRSP